MILDLGHFQFVNDKEPESSSNSNFVDDIDDDDGMVNHCSFIICSIGFFLTFWLKISSSIQNHFVISHTDEFATPFSSPPSEEDVQQLSHPAPPIELQSALAQSISQSHLNISEKCVCVFMHVS